MNESLPRIYHDFNNLDVGSDETMAGASLLCLGTQNDLEKKKIELIDGMKVILYQEDDVDSDGNPDFLEVEATVREKDGGRYFSGEFIFSELMHRSERKETQPIK
jgi:hypothetical protein